MRDSQRVQITLTREQQLAMLAATGFQVKTLEVETRQVSEDGEATAEILLPPWLQQALAGGSPEARASSDHAGDPCGTPVS
jgi:hypothetical protein